MGRIFMNLKNEIDPMGYSWGYIYDQYSLTNPLVYHLRSQVSVFRTIGPSSISLKTQVTNASIMSLDFIALQDRHCLVINKATYYENLPMQ